LNELEKQLGFQVFERDNKKVLVTPIGHQVLEKARAVKNTLDEIKQLADSQKAPLSFEMTIGVIPTIGPYLLPKILPKLTSKYPDLKLQIIEEQSQTLVEMVRQGEIDTAILALPFPCDGLLSFEFWQEDFFWVTQSKDPRASQSEIGSEEFDAEKLMLLKDGHCLKDQALAVCKLAGIGNRFSVGATSLNTIMPMVSAGMGTTLIPGMARKQLIADNPNLSAIHLNEPGPHRTLAFILRPNYAGLNSIEQLIALCKSEMEKH
jgi:LysR family hydrogen peroxide-inducible transcriptional activator